MPFNWRKNKENVVDLHKYSVILKNEILKFSDDWTELEKYHSNEINQDPERQIWDIYSLICGLAVKSIITKL